jgi:uncharacterized membrane protein YvbJ
MFCTKCGETIDDSSQNCPKCGAVYDEWQPPQSKGSSGGSYSASIWNKWLKFDAWAIFILIILAGIYAAYNVAQSPILSIAAVLLSVIIAFNVVSLLMIGLDLAKDVGEIRHILRNRK